MELNIFNFRKLRRIRDRYRNFQTFLGDVLDGERSLIHSEESEGEIEPFEPSDSIEDILLPTSSRGMRMRKMEARMEQLFESIAPYFEAGLLLQAAPESGTRLREMFVAGRIFLSPSASGESLALALPEVEIGAVAKGRAKPILRLVQLDRVKRLQDTSAFLLTPVPGWSMVLFCGRPHPWQVGFIERVRNAIVKVMS